MIINSPHPNRNYRLFSLWITVSVLMFGALSLASCAQETPEPMKVATDIPKGVEVLGIVETDEVVSEIKQRKRFNQCDSSGPFKTAIRFSQSDSSEQQQAVTLEASVGAEAGLSQVAKVAIGGKITSFYGNSEIQVLGREEEALITVPALKWQEYILTWKETRRTGVVHYEEDGVRKTAEYNYRLGLQLDETTMSNLICPDDSLARQSVPPTSVPATPTPASTHTSSPATATYTSTPTIAPTSEPTKTVLPVTSTPTTTISVSLQSRNKIAFNSMESGNWDIYIVNEDGTELKPLLKTTADEMILDWSEKTERFLLRMQEPQLEGSLELFTMGINSSSPHQITTDMMNVLTASWSPDGEHIALASNRKQYEHKPICGRDNPRYGIWILTNGIERPVQLASGVSENGTNCGNNSPSWSPDGRYVAFSLLRKGWDIFMMNDEGGELCPIVESSEPKIDDESPNWSPDGRLIVYTSMLQKDDEGGIYITKATCNSSESPITVIAERDTIYEAPIWSPDGSKITYASKKDNNWDIYVAEVSPEGVLLHQPQRLTESPVEERGPVWITSSTDPPSVEAGEPLIDLGVDTATTCERLWTITEDDFRSDTNSTSDTWSLTNPGTGTLVIEPDINTSCPECVITSIGSMIIPPGALETQLSATYDPQQDPFRTPGHQHTITVHSNAINCPLLKVNIVIMADIGD